MSPPLPAQSRPHRRRTALFPTALPLLVLVAAAGCESNRPTDAPALAVILVVDQLTPELLDRYEPALAGGFARLRAGGHEFTDAVHDHAITYTSPGHASPVTGVVPARHGIISNSWREFRDGRWVSVSSVADPTVRTVGGSGAGNSPANLLREGLPDWLLAEHPSARVVSISGKPTAANLMAGSGPAHAYWFSVRNAGFVTSSHFRDELPRWVADFNEGLVERLTAEPCWESAVPDEHAPLSRRDTVEYEADGVHTHFPHCVDDGIFNSPAHFVSRTPALDRATLALAGEALRELELGRRGVPDYLAVGLASTDRVGHEFGPHSREQLDNLLRLDRELARFLELLDEEVGEGRYLIALTSDHGVLPLPEYLQEEGLPGIRFTSEVTAALRAAAEELGVPGPEVPGAEAAEARARLAAEMETIDWVEQAFTIEELMGEAPADSFAVLYRNSFHPDRLTSSLAAFGVELRLAEGTLVRGSGTTHGVPYLHDRSVPLLFYGFGVAPDRTAGPARTVDLAPTVARLLGVGTPDDLDGRPLLSPASAR